MGRAPRVTIAVAGVFAVTLYAAWAAVQILVLNPLAVVPGAGLTEIYAQMDAAGETMPVAAPLIWLIPGVVAAAVVAVIGIRMRLEPAHIILLFLVLLVLGAPGYFLASFLPGMSLADAFATGGGDHSPWSLPLYTASAAAAVAALVPAVRLSARRTPIEPSAPGRLVG